MSMSPEVKGAIGGLSAGLAVDLFVVMAREGDVQDAIPVLIMIPIFLALAGAIAGGTTRR